jgi:hypothetical protein
MINKAISPRPPITLPTMAPIGVFDSLEGGCAVEGDAPGVATGIDVEAMLAVRVINAFALKDVAGETR